MRRLRGPGVLTLVLGLGTFAGVLAAQDDSSPADDPPPPLVEGPLNNDCFLPISAAANVALGRGDALLARGRTDAGSARDTAQAYEAWIEALAVSAIGDSVWLDPDPEGERRATEGVERAVLRRLAALDEEGRAAWVERFAGPARSSLARGADTARRYPGTPAAARAALRSADRALERGDWREAFARSRRGLVHARLAAVGPELIDALEARRNLAIARQPAHLTGRQAWTGAVRLAPRGDLVLPDEDPLRASTASLLPERGVRPGLVFLDDDTVLVQTAVHLYTIDLPPGREPRIASSLHLRELAWEAVGEVERPRTGREAPGWAHQPAVADGAVFLVHGRASREAGGVPNTLFCIELDALGSRLPSLPGTGRPAPLRWAVSGDRLLDAAGNLSTPENLESFASVELQPAPLVVGSLVVVQARVYEGDARSWLLAFDVGTGDLVWRRLLAKGADLSPQMGRFGADAGPRLAPMPPVAAGPWIFAGTHLGAAALVDPLDGSLVWTVRNRRRPPADRGWGGGAVPGAPRAGEDHGGHLLWAPADSDRLYHLLAAPFRGPQPSAADLFAAPPRPLATAETLVGGDQDEVIVLGRAGADRAWMAWRADRARRITSVYVGPDESFRGRGLASAGRVYGCTDRGVYLFDRRAELYFLDYQPLPARGSAVGGDLFAHGDRVVVLGPDALWIFKTESP